MRKKSVPRKFTDGKAVRSNDHVFGDWGEPLEQEGGAFMTHELSFPILCSQPFRYCVLFTFHNRPNATVEGVHGRAGAVYALVGRVRSKHNG